MTAINIEYLLAPMAELVVSLDRWGFPKYAISLEVGDEISIETTLHPVNGPPEAGIPALGIMNLPDVPIEDDTFTIGTIVYRMRDSGNLAQDFDITIGFSAAVTQSNIIVCIMGTGVPGSQYFEGTPEHPLVTAQLSGTADAIDIIAKEPGEGGNTIPTTETFTSSGNDFNEATLEGGINGEDIPIWSPAWGILDGAVDSLDVVTLGQTAFLDGPVEAIRLTALTPDIVCHGRIMQTGAK